MLKLLFLLFSSLKLGKLLASGGTMLLSVVMYSFVFGWKYAVGFVLLIFVHEMGHFVAARQRGLDVGLPTFIPFLGAWVSLKSLPTSAEQQAYIGLAGPVAGSLAAWACYLAGQSFNSDLLLALGYSGFILNLLNLIPLAAMDGGHITAAISPKIWWFGMPVCIAMFMYTKSPMLLLLIILSIPQVLAGRKAMPEDYFQTPMSVRILYATLYIGLIILLGVMSVEVHDMLAAQRQAHGIGV